MQTRVHVDIYEEVRQGDGWKVWNLNTESSLCAGSWVGLCQHMMKSTRSCRKWREENPFKLIELFPSLTVWMTDHVLVSKCNNKQGNEKNSNLIHQTEKHWIIHTEPLAVLLIMFNCISEGISNVTLSTRSSQTRADVPDKLHCSAKAHSGQLEVASWHHELIGMHTILSRCTQTPPCFTHEGSSCINAFCIYICVRRRPRPASLAQPEQPMCLAAGEPSDLGKGQRIGLGQWEGGGGRRGGADGVTECLGTCHFVSALASTSGPLSLWPQAK